MTGLYPRYKIALLPFIIPDKGCDEHVRKIFNMKNVQPNIYLTIRDVYSIVAMVNAGLGINIMPEMTLPQQLDHIVIIKFNDDVYRRNGIAAPTFDRLSPANAKFLDHTKS